MRITLRLLHGVWRGFFCGTMVFCAKKRYVAQSVMGEGAGEDWEILHRRGKELYPTHAFELLTDNRIRFAKIQCALFKGTSRAVFIDQREYDGPIYKQVDEAYQFVLKHINLGAEIEGLYRKEQYEIPADAVREAIANAVVHRSYLDDSCIQVSIYDDRIEIDSPGMLYGGIDLETAKRGKSRCRNATLAEAFHYMHYIEAWGTGIPRILHKCKEYGLKEPVFEEFGDGFKVILFRKVVNAPEKVVNAPEKVVNAPEKVVNASEKVVNAPEKVVNGFGKYEDLLRKKDVTKTFVANIQSIFEQYGDRVFGQSNVMECLHCSKTKAANVIHVMRKTDVIAKVTGFGNGKYKFIEIK